MKYYAPNDLSPVSAVLFDTLVQQVAETRTLNHQDVQTIAAVCRDAEMASAFFRAAKAAMHSGDTAEGVKLNNASIRASSSYRAGLDNLRLSVAQRSSKAEALHRAQGDVGDGWGDLLN
ncbi:hypothetical protein [Sedimentitalea sp.]|uniref:hypothetical protein n=1 Tax=Sedimentitalea sp. TaxID=2048915 RepID=UPI0032980DB8